MSSKKSNFNKDKTLKTELIKKYGDHEKDTGSPIVQIALLTERINYLSNHLKINKKDKHSRRGLLKLVGDRRRLIKYVERTTEDAPKVNKIMKELGLKATV
ncbi:MAG: 30S ribosomal protein S15 [Candidatus Dojkabacteria bacterium]